MKVYYDIVNKSGAYIWDAPDMKIKRFNPDTGWEKYDAYRYCPIFKPASSKEECLEFISAAKKRLRARTGYLVCTILYSEVEQLDMMKALASLINDPLREQSEQPRDWHPFSHEKIVEIGICHVKGREFFDWTDDNSLWTGIIPTEEFPLTL
jgi:hypothetical protein